MDEGVVRSYPIRLDTRRTEDISTYSNQQQGYLFAPTADVEPDEWMHDPSSVFHAEGENAAEVYEQLIGEGTLIEIQYGEQDASLDSQGISLEMEIDVGTEPASLDAPDLDADLMQVEEAFENAGYSPEIWFCTNMDEQPSLTALDDALSRVNAKIEVGTEGIHQLQYDPQRQKIYAFKETAPDIITGGVRDKVDEEELAQLEEAAENAGMDFSDLRSSP